MVKGLQSLIDWFNGYENCFTIIGGVACDLLMSEAGLDFRATKDVDMVLIIEAISSDFGSRFWEYITLAGYEHCNKSTGSVQFYRFSKPTRSDYPAMIELFSRRPDAIFLPPDAHLTPIPLDDEISSLSAILLDDAYYNLLRAGKEVLNGVPILNATHLILFKAKAWLDLTDRSKSGQHIDSRDITKHKNDVLRLMSLLSAGDRVYLPSTIKRDITLFLKNAPLEHVFKHRLAETFEIEDVY